MEFSELLSCVMQQTQAAEGLEKREGLPAWTFTDFAWYHRQIQYLSNSMLGVFRQDGPEMFAGQYVTGTIPKKDTKAFAEGRRRHLAILELDLFQMLAVPIPTEALAKDGSRKGKAWDAFKAEHEARLQPLGQEPIFLKQSELAEIYGQRQAILRDFGPLIEKPGAVESSIFWRCPVTGAYLRCRPDKVIDCGDYWRVFDFKTAATTKPSKLYYHVRDFGYANQHALYEDGLMAMDGKPVRFAFLACENTPPYNPVAFEFDPDTVAAARERNYRDIERIEWSKATGVWHHPNRDRIHTFRIRPHYFEKDLDEWRKH